LDPKDQSSKDGEGQPEGSQEPTDKQATSGTPDAKYKGLQQALDTERNRAKELEAELRKTRGDPSAEEERDALREELEKLRGDIAIRDLKVAHPELADVIDVAVAEGTKLTPGVLAALKAKLGTKPAEQTRPETSGIRNGGPADTQLSGDEARYMDILKKGNLF